MQCPVGMGERDADYCTFLRRWAGSITKTGADPIYDPIYFSIVKLIAKSNMLFWDILF